MNVMKPIASTEIPTSDEWIYEVKYDGFRCTLIWGQNGEIRLVSKNNHELTANFPEIVSYCKEKEQEVKKFLPLKLDGELVVLNNTYQANFSWIQKRGRLKTETTIQNAAQHRPATFMVFDILELKGKSVLEQSFIKRKEQLTHFLDITKLMKRIKLVEPFTNSNHLSELVFQYKSEGIIAKRKNSRYVSGKGHRDWIKIKNWRTFQGFLTEYDRTNQYFTIQVFNNKDQPIEIGKCKHGLDADSFQTIQQLFTSNGEKNGNVYHIPPAICASINTLDIYRNELREPEFASLLPNLSANECTLERFELDMAMLPTTFEISNTEKLYWPNVGITKGEFLVYMREIAPYILPFLENRALTIIRCPDGVTEESFFQKNLPSYAPDFIKGVGKGDEKKIICDSLDSFIWFANHGAIEFHIPFQTIKKDEPLEIVFDLDPPDRSKFHLAVKAAKMIKQLLDDLQLHSFVKTSGNKGLQIHIPIPENSMTYEDTGVFTQAVAWTIENQSSEWFTTERMKNKRNGRLYIDYVQHGKGKTIIAPYSPRKTKEGTIATPLFWEELTDKLRPEQFTIKNGLERVQAQGCPFRNYFEVGQKQNMEKVRELMV